jgi:hypothetical protein
MIQINVTLFVQMFNFIVAWKILDAFFLRQCVKEVQGEREVVLSLEKCVESEKNALKKTKEVQQGALESLRKDFVAALPPVPEDLSPKNISLDPFSFSRECDVASRRQITEETVAFLVKRITNV